MRGVLGLAAVLVAALAAVFATGAVAQGKQHAAAGSTSASTPVLVNCGELMVKPWQMTLACADANYGLTGMTWKSWGGPTATATGTASVNDCTPNCAAGHFKDYPVSATASGPHLCPTGVTYYTKLALTYGASRPAGVHKVDTVFFPCDQGEPGPTIITSAGAGQRVTLSGLGWLTDHTMAKDCSRTVALAYLKNGHGVIGHPKISSTGTFTVTWKAPKTGYVLITGTQPCTGSTPAPKHSLNGFYYSAVVVNVIA